MCSILTPATIQIRVVNAFSVSFGCPAGHYAMYHPWCFSPLIAVALCCLTACNAPRNNPFDPGNPNNVLHTISGTVRTSSGAAIPGVLVLWENENIYVMTNSAGNFTITTTQPTDGWLTFEKSGFFVDSLFVRWGGQKSIALQHALDALPVLDSVFVYTVVKNTYSLRRYSLVVRVQVIDDDDVDSVWVSNTELQLWKKLTKESATTFGREFFDYDLTIASFEELVGRPLSIIAHDGNNRTLTIGSGLVTRVIQQEIELLSPLNQDTVTNPPRLRWRRFEPGFRFTYRLEVYTDEPDPHRVWSKANVSSDSVSIVTDSITIRAPENRYFWVNWCIDEFNNQSRSKPASFILLFPN